MSLNDQQAQELARVLQTLAALSPQGSQRPQATHQSLPIHSATGSNSVVPGGAYPSNPSQHSHVSQLLNSLVVPPTAAAPVGHHVRVEMPILVPSQVERPRAGDSRKATPSADPATILDWPLGLRCVAKIAAQNPDFEPAIRKMILEQQRHEKQWWAGRESLIEQQAARVEGSRKIQDLLRSLGGAASSGVSASKEHNQAELDAYDRKVLKASQDMVKAMSLELRTLGVPFFGVRPSLVDHPERSTSDAGTDSGPRLTITAAELLTLQRRMLQYLQDMYKP